MRAAGGTELSPPTPRADLSILLSCKALEIQYFVSPTEQTGKLAGS